MPALVMNIMELLPLLPLLPGFVNGPHPLCSTLVDLPLLLLFPIRMAISLIKLSTMSHSIPIFGLF